MLLGWLSRGFLHSPAGHQLARCRARPTSVPWNHRCPLGPGTFWVRPERRGRPRERECSVWQRVWLCGAFRCCFQSGPGRPTLRSAGSVSRRVIGSHPSSLRARLAVGQPIAGTPTPLQRMLSRLAPSGFPLLYRPSLLHTATHAVFRCPCCCELLRMLHVRCFARSIGSICRLTSGGGSADCALTRPG